MANEQSRITVVGELRRVDIAVPSTTPIGEYALQLAELCGEAGTDMMPPAWSLAVAGGQAYPPVASLYDLGVVDGQVLYLRDITEEPGDAPVVMDIDEVVADESARQRRARLYDGPAVLAFGLVWMVVAAVLTARTTALNAGSVTAVVLVVSALALLGTGWGLRQKAGPVPEVLVQLVVFAALPCLAVAGLIVGGGLAGADYRWAGAVAGANLAGLMGLALTPAIALAAVEIQLMVAAVTATLLIALDAGTTQALAAIAAVAVAVVVLGRRIAAATAAWGARRPRGGRSAAEATTQLVQDTSRLLAVVMAGPAAVLVFTLPPLALSGKPFAVTAAAAVSIALLARARQAAVTSELVATAGTGLTGLFTLIVAGLRILDAPAAVATTALLAAGLLVAACGVAMAYLTTPDANEGGETTAMPRPPRRRSRAEAVGMVAGLAIGPLTLGVFGVFGHLITVGRGLF